jgi:Spy/CpxP family protein refolding chaperone
MMKHKLLSILVVFAVVIGLSASAVAQGMRATPEQRTQRLKDSLSLNEKQVAKVLDIYKDLDKKRQDLFSSAGDDRQAMMQSMRTLMDSSDAKIERLLTPGQKTKFDELKKQRQQRGPRPGGN